MSRHRVVCIYVWTTLLSLAVVFSHYYLLFSGVYEEDIAENYRQLPHNTASTVTSPIISKKALNSQHTGKSSGIFVNFSSNVQKLRWQEVLQPLNSTQSQQVVEIRDQIMRGTFASRASCRRKGMQSKCLFTNFIVQNNQFYVIGEMITRDVFPNPIYPADGFSGPLVKYHKYIGHRIHHIKYPELYKEPNESYSGNGNQMIGGKQSGSLQDGINTPNIKIGNERQATICRFIVTRPIVFLYRMSGHSTFHLWENNLGPLFSTLQESFGDETLTDQLNDPSKLLIAFVDTKPVKGSKAPVILDRLLRTFSNVELINASAIHERTCFTKAVVGISSSGFPHRKLLHRMMKNVAGYDSPDPLPEYPTVLYISRNHPSVVRGRMISNEDSFLSVLNRTIYKETGGKSVVNKIFMQDYTIEEQIQISMKSHMMFSPHGGGVTNCIWMGEGSVVVEFVSPVGEDLTNMYHRMCGNSGVTHFHFLADPDPADVHIPKADARLFSNMVVPPEVIERNARKAMRLYNSNYRKQKTRMGNNIMDLI